MFFSDGISLGPWTEGWVAVVVTIANCDISPAQFLPHATWGYTGDPNNHLLSFNVPRIQNRCKLADGKCPFLILSIVIRLNCWVAP